MTEVGDEDPDETDAPRPRRRFGLSSKLLLLTVVFVMLCEVLIYVPSLSGFQKTQVVDRLRSAAVATLALTAIPATAVPADLQAELLDELDARAIAVRSGGVKRLIAMTETPPPMVAREMDVDAMTPAASIRSAFDTLVFGGDRMIRAVGAFPGGGEIEIVFSEASLRRAMLVHSRNILVLSVVISTLSACLVYVSLRWLFVRPMQRIGKAVARWAEDPADASRIIEPSRRSDEFGLAEEMICEMQHHVQDVLAQQRRLAELGLAVSKINHDLRNLLASAQLMSDRLAAIPDPTVQRFAPKLIGALDRAISYAQSVLSYGKAQEAPPARRLLSLRKLVDEVGDITGLSHQDAIDWVNGVPAELEVDADSDHLFRVLLNLVRNAAQALEQDGDEAVIKRLTVAAERTGSVVSITVVDTGPGVPARAREHLFRPFQGSVRRGGTGLGLAIAAELVRAHGGTIALLDEGPGAAFEIEIPDRPVSLAEIKRTRTG